MPHVVSSQAGQLELADSPLGLRVYWDGDQPALQSGGPAAFVRVYGVEYALRLDRHTPFPLEEGGVQVSLVADLPSPVQGRSAETPNPSAANSARSTQHAALVTLTITPTSGGFRLALAAPAGAEAVGLAFQADPGTPWYGGGERVVQDWPLNRHPVTAAPFVTYDYGPDGTLNIATPLWFGAGAGTGAVGVLAAGNGELEMSLNRGGDGLLRLGSRPPPLHEVPAIGQAGVRVGPRLTVDLFLADDVAGAFQAAVVEIGHPTSAPPAGLFEQPIWTTWARYKMAIDQPTTLAFAADIVAHGFGRAVLEIDDRWQAGYGELRFDPIKFPDPAALIATLHAQGFAVTLWTPTFFSPGTPAYAEAAAAGYLVRHPGDGTPYLVRWWQGYGGLLDVSHPAALAWWLAGLQRLQREYGVDGFKFDAGEANFLPTDAVTHAPLLRTDYSDIYVNFVGRHFPYSEVRTGYRAQRTPILFRQWDKWSRWGLDNGLHACITQALALSLAGYPFILPDMIGGNAYDGETADRELLIRWTEMNALLPAMQFSLPPWDYDAETVAICRRYTELHTAFAPYLHTLIAEATRNGTPIIRPLFWHFPQDRATYTIDDSFLLGDRYLVAPVVQAGTTTRAVYLPPGHWRDYWTGTVYPGGLLPAYPAPLAVLPIFVREA